MDGDIVEDEMFYLDLNIADEKGGDTRSLCSAELDCHVGQLQGKTLRAGIRGGMACCNCNLSVSSRRPSTDVPIFHRGNDGTFRKCLDGMSGLHQHQLMVMRLRTPASRVPEAVGENEGGMLQSEAVPVEAQSDAVF